MKIKEIDTLAKKKLPLPDKPDILELGLYTALTNIYAEYDAKTKTADEAKQAKQAVCEEYEYLTGLQAENVELSRRIAQHVEIFKRDDAQRVKLCGVFAEAEKHGCEICKKISRVYDGRE